MHFGMHSSVIFKGIYIFAAMMKIKHLLLLVCIAGCFASCSKDSFDADEQFRNDTTAIRRFITTNNIPAVKDKSGLFYQIIAPGTGAVTYTANTSITAEYEGKLLDGAVFDATKSGSPITFTLGGVITGWQIGIPLIQPGGRIRMIIPSGYAYGNSAAGAIPANSILDFTVTLSSAK
jgi:FKBP-type peptidyl-prolyl cis-trans isomerase FkpA